MSFGQRKFSSFKEVKNTQNITLLQITLKEEIDPTILSELEDVSCLGF